MIKKRLRKSKHFPEFSSKKLLEYIESIKALIPGSTDDEFWKERLEVAQEIYITKTLLDMRK